MCDVTVLHRQRLDLLCCCSHTANSLPHYVMSTPACVLLRSPQAFPLHALLAMTTTICIIPVQWQLSFSDTWIILFTRDLRSFEIRFEFESAVQIRFDSKVMGRFQNFRIGRACPLLVVVKWLKPLTALAQYKDSIALWLIIGCYCLIFLRSGMKKSVVLHISFVSFTVIVINYWSLNARFDSYSIIRRGTC